MAKGSVRKEREALRVSEPAASRGKCKPEPDLDPERTQRFCFQRGEEGGLDQRRIESQGECGVKRTDKLVARLLHQSMPKDD